MLIVVNSTSLVCYDHLFTIHFYYDQYHNVYS
jgi:hypothetical protein